MGTDGYACSELRLCYTELMKLMIWIGITIGGIVGGGIGSLLDHGNMLGAWSIILGAVGSLAGIWLGIKLDNLI